MPKTLVWCFTQHSKLAFAAEEHIFQALSDDPKRLTIDLGGVRRQLPWIRPHVWRRIGC